MSLQFYVGPSGSGKSTRVYRDILARAAEDIQQRYFVVVPDQFTMRTQQVLCQLSESGGIMNVEVLSFGRLAHRIFEECNCEQLTRLDDTGKNLILRAVANEHLDELSVLKRNLKRTGNIAQVKSMISEFAQYGISPDDLSLMIEATNKQSNLSAKLHDLQVLYRAYQEYIRGNYITTEETIDLLIRLVPQSALLKDSVVIFDGYTGFTPIQENLIRELLLHTRQVIVTLLGDTMEDVQGEVCEQDLFYLTAKAYHRLTRIADELRVPLDAPVVLSRDDKTRFSCNAPLGHLEKQLFRPQVSDAVSCEAKVQICLGADPKAEVDFVCTKMKQLIRQKDYAYRDFAVITGDLGSYGKILTESFAEHEIPLFLDQNASLLYHPFMVLLNGLIDVVNRDFSYDSVMNVLRTGYLGLEEAEIDYFELYLLRYGVRGYRKYRQDFIRTDEDRGIVNVVRARLMEVLQPLLDASHDAKGYVRALYDICVLLDMEGALGVQAKAFLEVDDFAKAKEYEQVYGAVMNLFDQIYDLLDEAMDLEAFGEILKAGFAELKVGTIPQSVDQVVAGDLERTRLKPIKVLFIIGVNDGIIPGKGGSGGILSDMERSLLQDVLRQRQWELAPTPREKGFEERIYLYMNMTQPQEQLILTYAGVSTSGEALRPSYLVDVVTKLYCDLRVFKLAEANLIDGIESAVSAKRALATLLRDYVDGQIAPGSDEMNVLLQLMDACKEDAHFVDVMTAAFLEYRPSQLPADVVEALFGKVIHSSVSRLEKFSRCAYAHFLQYGVKLQDTETFEFDSADLGMVYHSVLCQFGEKMRDGEYSWLTITKEESDALIEQFVDDVAKDTKRSVLYDNHRNMAMKKRVQQIAKTTVDQLAYQLRKGLFEPRYYEMEFYKKGNPSLGGKVDRVDYAFDEATDKAYVKIIDYKSSAHDFDPVKLYLGLDLQLAVYLDEAMKKAQADYKDKSVVPAAILYYQIQDPMMEAAPADSPEVRELALRRECRGKGLILEDSDVLECMDTSKVSDSDVMRVKFKKDGGLSSSSQTATRQQMDLIGAFASYKLGQIAREIQKGDIAVAPYKDKNASACDYCSYKGVCGYDPKIPGFGEKRMESVDKKEVYERMEACLKEEMGGEQS